MAKIELIIGSMRQDLPTYEWVILLRDKSKERYLPIYVSQAQGDIIQREMDKKAVESEYYGFSIPGVGVTIHNREKSKTMGECTSV